MAPREPTRKVHITRILGTNKQGEVLPDIWLDLERFEQYAKVTQTSNILTGLASQFQRIISKFRWHDDPDDGEEYQPENDDGTARNTFVMKVCSPDEEDLDNPEEWVPVRVIKAVHLTHGDEPGSDTNQKFITKDLTAERKIKTRRILHYDTSIDDKAKAAFDADPARKAYVAKADDYEKDDASKDEDQYVEQEIVTSITKQTSAHALTYGTDQQVIVKFKNQYLIDETEEAKLEEVGNEGKNPPYRLDPFQNIINVQWAPRVYVVITAAKTDYAVPNRKMPGVKVVETKQAPGPQSAFMTGTLIECSANAGEDFASLNSTMVGGPGGEGGGEGSTLIAVIVYPKTEKVREKWWEYVKRKQGVFSEEPDEGPYLWIAEFRAYDPCKVDFDIEYEGHLKGPAPPGIKDTMVQAYPTSGAHTGTGSNGESVTVSGFYIPSYRLDKKGTKTIYKSPPEWTTDVGITTVSPDLPGLFFGKEPALIAADKPKTP